MEQIWYCPCPSCKAMFRLQSAKLQLSNGMVKCGACRHIFNAVPLLLESSDSGFVPCDPETLSKIRAFLQQPDSAVSRSNDVSQKETHSQNLTETDDSQPDEPYSNLEASTQWFDTGITRHTAFTEGLTEIGIDWTQIPLYDSIAEYSRAEQSGTVVIVFADYSMAKIYLEKGIPAAARYRATEGTDVFRLCGNLGVLTVDFHEDENVSHSLKDLNSILDL